MKHLKRIIAIILVLAVFVGSFFGSRALFTRGTYEYDVHDLSVFDDDDKQYYLKRTDTNIIFRVDVPDGIGGEAGFSLLDSAGKTVNVRASRISKTSFDILPPDGGYKPGERYTLSLSDGMAFHDEDLADARELVFCIERENVESYQFTDAVVETDSAITLVEEDVISVDDGSLKAGDIVFGKDENGDYVVYRIDELLGGGKAAISTPAIDEIYSDLDVYGQYTWDVHDIVTNPDIEIEIIENVKNSNFVKSLFTSAYADYEKPKDGGFEIKLTPDYARDEIEVEVTITLEPGERGLFGITSLKNQAISLTLKNKLGLTTDANIQGLINWDVSASLTAGYTWQLSVSLYTNEWSTDKELKDVFTKENAFTNFINYQKNVKKLTEKLNQIAADAAGGEIKLFDWKLPVPSIPGLYFSAQVKLFAKFEVAADIVVSQSNTTMYTVGLCFADFEFRPYCNKYSSGSDVELSLRGKAEAKAGIKLEIKAVLIHENVANITLDPQVGGYAELFITLPVTSLSETDSNSFIYGYFEMGAYFSCNISAMLNIGIQTFEGSFELVEEKAPILTLGNDKIAIGLTSSVSTVHAVSRTLIAPDIMFEYVDVKEGGKGVDTLSPGDVKFMTSDGTELHVSDGKITLPEASDSGSCYITAAYQHTDGMTYRTMFRALISGSMLEGQVSAYGDDLSLSALEGAKVELYSGSTQTSPISYVITDESGKFSFNVAEGSYKLVISADGYRTLTSNQKVGTDEIKYTEHILLMDTAQSGSGSAGGRVTNALDGHGLSGITLRLRPDWNNTSGSYYSDFTATTDSNGHYSFSGVPTGYYTVEAEGYGYVTGYSNILILSRGAKDDFDFSITPILPENEVRIVLTWGEYPSDLDSHLIGLTPANDSFNVYYNDKIYRYNSVDMANLDVDDVTSYGPETVTITEDIYGVYTYAVHDYTNRNSSGSNSLSYSGATVKVFIGSAQVAEYHVPTDQIGTYWTVFQIDSARRIMPINTISNTKPTAR